MTDNLKFLAEHCGIADLYHDIWGGNHLTSARTCQALLTAMHYPEKQVATAPAALLGELTAAEWRQALPPVVVARTDSTIHVPLNLTHAASTQEWRWMIVEESGASCAAQFKPADQPSLGTQADRLRCQLELPPIATMGYHLLQVHSTDKSIQLAMPLIVVPPQCHQPAALRKGERLWGLTLQLYGIRSGRNWGIGDFTDLGDLLELTAAAGGHLVGVNPLHALFPDNPAHISPYSPSQRSFVNVLYLDVEAIPEFSTCIAAQRRLSSADFQARLQTLRAAEFVDYPGVAQLKFGILEMLYEEFRTGTAADATRQTAFAVWCQAQGEELERHARFEALQASFRATDAHIWGWPAWPQEYRDPSAPAVAAFAATHKAAVTYHAWLQWQADSQLAAVAQRAQQSGMAVGLYQDLAVGANPGGAEAWTWQDVFAQGVHVGAPPDEINLMGQDWGLPPFVPERLRAAAYAPFIDILRANMKHAGALRIDHVMGLLRLFWVPANIPASEGAYVHYPFEDLLGIVALESQRNQCLVIGEDLGTVPDGFRPRLAECGILSYHPLIFERYPDGNFRLPADMPQQALVAAGTHDLPTLRGYWHGEDLNIRASLKLFPNEEMRQRLLTERDWDRGRLLWALERENLRPAGVSKNPSAMPELSADCVLAIHAYLGRSAAQIMMVQPEDILAVRDQPNFPGTLENQHPNWQRKLPLPIAEWPRLAAFGKVTSVVSKARKSKSSPA
jgi:(1->4)-alpha-D-glucan 1-alpha-D-glucosylmutase